MQGDVVFDTALAAELEADGAAFEPYVTAVQGGQAIGAVVAQVLPVADANQRRVEQADYQRHHFSGPSPCQVFVQLAQGRQGLGEGQQAPILVLVALLAPLLMVAVLFAPRASRPVACKWPCGSVQIHTSV
jgi:hypothetical protein